MSRVGGAGDGDAGVGLFQGRGVVYPVARRAHDVAPLLQHIDDVILVLGVDLGEAVDLLDRVVHLRGLVMLGFVEDTGVQDVHAHLQLPGDLAGDDDLIARDHLHADAHLLGGDLISGG